MVVKLEINPNSTLGGSQLYREISNNMAEFQVYLNNFDVRGEGGTGPLTHMFLSNLIWATNAKLVYEIGMNFGGCSLRLLNALEYTNGRLRLFEIDRLKSPVYTWLADKYQDRVSITWGDSNATLGTIQDEHPDIIFVDGLHTQHAAATDLKLSLEILKVGGYVVMDDWDYPAIRVAAHSVLSPEQWSTAGIPGGGEIAFYQKKGV